jgi:hypothetical protein
MTSRRISGVAHLHHSGPANETNIRYIFRNNAEFPIMTASEMQFLKAEAQLRKGDKAGALASYSNAINLNFDMLTTKYTANDPCWQGDHTEHPGKLPGSRYANCR